MKMTTINLTKIPVNVPLMQPAPVSCFAAQHRPVGERQLMKI